MSEPLSEFASEEEMVSRQMQVHYHLTYSLGKTWDTATAGDLFIATALALRENLIDRMTEAESRYGNGKRAFLVSTEFSLGRSLGTFMQNLGLVAIYEQVAQSVGAELSDILAAEGDRDFGGDDRGLVAASLLESLATFDMPCSGYGLLFDYGWFRQQFVSGWQRESPVAWAAGGSPWAIARWSERIRVRVGGSVEHGDGGVRQAARWSPAAEICGAPYDFPVVGFGGRTVNALRLFSASPVDEDQAPLEQPGDYAQTLERRIESANFARILVPVGAEEPAGERHLLQDYFLSVCAVGDVLRRFDARHAGLDELPEKVALHLNGASTALVVPELMRRLVDEREVPWDQALDLTQRSLTYADYGDDPHLMRRWPDALLERICPRHLTIMREIADPSGVPVPTAASDNAGEDTIAGARSMRDLAMRGSHAVLSSGETQATVLRDRAPGEVGLDRVSVLAVGEPRRGWLGRTNGPLAALITQTIGDAWLTDPAALAQLEKEAERARFRRGFRRARRQAKERVTESIARSCQVRVDPESIFDVLAAPVLGDRRHLLFVFYIMHQYMASIVDQGEDGDSDAPDETPRTFILAGRAAPGDPLARLVIKLAHNVADLVNGDKRAEKSMRVAFLPDYGSSRGLELAAAADVAEQLGSATSSGSMTDAVRFAMHGALTLGGMNAAVRELKHRLGAEAVFEFGKPRDRRGDAKRSPRNAVESLYERDEKVRRLLDALDTDTFSADEHGIFCRLSDQLLRNDWHHVLTDFRSYLHAQQVVARYYAEPDEWFRRSVLCVARARAFSVDQMALDVAERFWEIEAAGVSTADVYKPKAA